MVVGSTTNSVQDCCFIQVKTLHISCLCTTSLTSRQSAGVNQEKTRLLGDFSWFSVLLSCPQFFDTVGIWPAKSCTTIPSFLIQPGVMLEKKPSTERVYVYLLDSDDSYRQRLEISRKIGVRRQSREIHHLVDVCQVLVQLINGNYRSRSWVGNVWHGVDITCDNHAHVDTGLTQNGCDVLRRQASHINVSDLK